MNLYTEAQILKDDECPQWADDFGMCGGIKYKLTESEIGWLDFARGRYSIVDYIDENTDAYGVTTFDATEFSSVLDGDGDIGKAVCLSDETALQKIFFYGYVEDWKQNED